MGTRPRVQRRRHKHTQPIVVTGGQHHEIVEHKRPLSTHWAPLEAGPGRPARASKACHNGRTSTSTSPACEPVSAGDRSPSMTSDRQLNTGNDAFSALGRAFPEGALEDLASAERAARELLYESRRAYAGGRTAIQVPAALAGGRLGWEMPLGKLRESLTRRLDVLVADGRARREEAAAVAHRFGLLGLPGGANEARQQVGRSRQATSDAVNRVIKEVAADLAMHPLMPVSAPRIDMASRQLVVGSTLSLLRGPAREFRIRQYVHMKVRAELLNDSEFPVATTTDAERQQRHRLLKQWLAIVSDHMDRGAIPWHLVPISSSEERDELAVWLRGDPATRGTPSVGALRALAEGGHDEAVKVLGEAQGTVGLFLDGYRPLIELLQVASWLHQGPQGEGFRANTGLRSAGVLSVSELVALRGYPDAAVLLAGHSHELEASALGARAWSRFRRLMVLESVSYLNGAPRVDETWRWQEALVDHLSRHGASHHGEPLAVAVAILRAEHAAWTAGAARGASVAELLAPLGEALDEALVNAPEENRRRFEIVRARLARVLADKQALALDNASDADLHLADPSDARVRSDEWYCANNVAISRWDTRGNARGQDEWRR